MFAELRTVVGIKSVTTHKQIKMARYAKAMGHPVRMNLLELLSKQSCCYSGDVSEEVQITKPTLYQHFKRFLKI